MTLIGKLQPGTLSGYLVLCLACAVAGLACGQPAVNSPETKTAPANTPVAAKPAETEAKLVDAKPIGKEVKAADGPALKSITPTEGTVLGGVLNDLAIDLPKPEFPADTKGSGTVTVEIVVSEKGEVVASSVVGGPQPLWSAAGAAARKARFHPPLKDGKPVKVAGVLTFDFGK